MGAEKDQRKAGSHLVQRGSVTQFYQLEGPAEDMVHLSEGIKQNSSAEVGWGKPEVMLDSGKT